MPGPHDILGALGRKRARPIVLVGQHPERLRVGVCLTDGVTDFELKDTQVRVGTRWWYVENMELHVGQWFREEDLHELRIRGSARNRRRDT